MKTFLIGVFLFVAVVFIGITSAKMDTVIAQTTTLTAQDVLAEINENFRLNYNVGNEYQAETIQAHADLMNVLDLLKDENPECVEVNDLAGNGTEYVFSKNRKLITFVFTEDVYRISFVNDNSEFSEYYSIQPQKEMHFIDNLHN